MITERDIIRVNERQSISSIGQDDGIVKKNPLLNMNRQFHEAKSFPSDSGSNLSDLEDLDSSVRSEDNKLFNVSPNQCVLSLNFLFFFCFRSAYRTLVSSGPQ